MSALDNLSKMNNEKLKLNTNMIILAGQSLGAKDVIWISGHYPEIVLGGWLLFFSFFYKPYL